MLRVIFFGNRLDILDELQQHARVAGVFYQPPRLSNLKMTHLLLRHDRLREKLRPLLQRGIFSNRWRRTLQKFAEYDYCQKNSLPLLTAASVHADDLVRSIVDLKADLGVVASFGHILPEPILSAARLGFINFHPSPLPRYRGANPCEFILLDGQTESAATWHRMAARMDAGPILCQEHFSIRDLDSVPALVRISFERGRRMLGPLLQAIEDGCVRETPQDESQATYCPRLPRKERKNLQRIIAEKKYRAPE